MQASWNENKIDTNMESLGNRLILPIKDKLICQLTIGKQFTAVFWQAFPKQPSILQLFGDVLFHLLKGTV